MKGRILPDPMRMGGGNRPAGMQHEAGGGRKSRLRKRGPAQEQEAGMNRGPEGRREWQI